MYVCISRAKKSIEVHEIGEECVFSDIYCNKLLRMRCRLKETEYTDGRTSSSEPYNFVEIPFGRLQNHSFYGTLTPEIFKDCFTGLMMLAAVRPSVISPLILFTLSSNTIKRHFQ